MANKKLLERTSEPAHETIVLALADALPCLTPGCRHHSLAPMTGAVEALCWMLGNTAFPPRALPRMVMGVSSLLDNPRIKAKRYANIRKELRTALRLLSRQARWAKKRTARRTPSHS